MILLALATTAAAQEGAFGFGRVVGAAEIAGWDIDVRPDGAGLPPGRGSVADGQAVYDAKCATCHGTFGESNSYIQIAGGVGSLSSDQPVRTTGSKLNHATTLFDYIRRAMPFTNPKSLSDDEVYALTAYVLNLNDILPADATLDRDSLPKIVMPNRDGFTTAHGFLSVAGKPDTANVACMSDCIPATEVASQIPAHARDAHGDLATQTGRGAGAAKPGALPGPGEDLESLARRSGCTACHAAETKVVGPAFREIAVRYRGDAGPARGERVAALANKVRSGGAGAWGEVAMPSQAQVADAEARALVEWILRGAPAGR